MEEPPNMKHKSFSRRSFLGRSLAVAAGAPWAFEFGRQRLLGAENASPAARASAGRRMDAKVAVVPCRTYGTELQPALNKCFDLLGGIGSLVRNKTVTVK